MPNSFPDIAIVNGARTPMGRYTGKLRDFTAQELAAIASIEAIKRSGVEAAEIDHCVMGNAQQTSSDAIYGARHVALKAGVPIETPAITVNRLCGSGMQSVVTAAQMIQLGESKCVLAGGMESMSQAPHVIRGMRWGVGFGEGKLEDSLFVALTDSYCNLPMAVTAEKYADQQAVTREMQDQYALCSQKRADAAYKAGKIQEELTPVPLRNRRGEPTGEMFTEDDHRRPETTLESLAKLKPSFGKSGTVTAGNASGIVDGGAAVIVMPLDEAQKRGLNPMARIVSWGIAGVDPALMGSGPVPATQIALEKAGLQLNRHRPCRTERSLCRPVPVGDERTRPRSCQDQRQRRRDRSWPSFGCDWHATAYHAGLRVAPPQSPLRTLDGLHRWRAGHCRDH